MYSPLNKYPDVRREHGAAEDKRPVNAQNRLKRIPSDNFRHETLDLTVIQRLFNGYSTVI